MGLRIFYLKRTHFQNLFQTDRFLVKAKQPQRNWIERSHRVARNAENTMTTKHKLINKTSKYHWFNVYITKV